MADEALESQERYLKQYKLDKVLEALIIETMRDQPDDPFAFMSEQMYKLGASFQRLVESPPSPAATKKQAAAQGGAKASVPAPGGKKGGKAPAPGGKKGGKGKGGGKQKGGGKKAAPAGPPPIFDVANDAVISCLDIRVGCISNPRLHPNADTLYVEDIDIGEEQPRTICSGLVKFIPMEVVVSNLKARKMQGIASAGMVMAAMSADGSAVELLRPPADAPVGERISFEGIEDGTPATGNQLNKQGKKALEAILSSGDLATNGACEAGWRGHAMTTTTGPVTTATLAGCKIK